MAGYSIIAPGVSVENFGAGKGQSRLQRFTSGLYANLAKSDGLDKMLSEQRTRQATQPYKDRATIAKARADSIADENKTLVAMQRQMGVVCNAFPNSAQCLAWDARVKGQAVKLETMRQQGAAEERAGNGTGQDRTGPSRSASPVSAVMPDGYGTEAEPTQSYYDTTPDGLPYVDDGGVLLDAAPSTSYYDDQGF